MLKFFNTIKYRMSIIVILALLLQIFMPVIENYAYAQEELGIAEEELEVDEPIEEVETPEEVEEPENPGEEDNGAAGSDIQPTEDKQPETMEQKPEKVETMEVKTAGEDEEPISNANESKLIEEDIIDNLRLFRKDGSEYQDGDLIDIDDDLRLELDWSLPDGHGYNAGDYFEFQLPEQLNIYNELKGNLDNFGSYVVETNGKVTFTFNEEIENHSDVKGTFWVDTELDKQKVMSTEEVLEFIINDDITKKISINIKPEGGQAIHKEGQPVGGNFNTEEIKWTVIVNMTRDSLENAVVTDPMPEGLELLTNSIEVKEVEVDISGNVIAEKEEEVIFTNKSSTNELNLEFGNTNKAYKITFKTNIKEEEKDREGWALYHNTAYLDSDGKDEKQSGASVSVQRPESLEKTSSEFNKEDRSVEWEVKANFNEKLLAKDTEIVDEFTFTIGEDVVDGVFEVTDIKISQVDSFNSDGSPADTSDAKDLFDITIDGNKITYKLKEETNKAFIIKYKTKAKDDAYITDDGTISNTVSIDGKTKTSSQGVAQQVGVKTNSGINYEDRTIDWTIVVNADKQNLRNFILTDDFSGSGQKLVEDSIKVEPAIDKEKINLNPDGIPEGEGFEINFGDITDTYTITYKTKFTYDFGDVQLKPNFKNGVNITYTTRDGKDYELKIEDQVPPNNNTKNNGVKNGIANNETKEITWTVDINYNQLELDNAKLSDEIAENQSLVDGSVKISETTINGDGDIIIGNDVTGNFTEKIRTNNNLVEIDFGPIHQSYRVEFATIDKDGIYNSDEVYENTAQFIPREGEEHNLYANVTLPNQGEFLGKKGLHNKEDWTVDWTIDVNKSKSKLTNVTVKDNLGEGQILLEDTIKVKKAGSHDELEKGTDYTLYVKGNTLSITFQDEITDAYEITYSSYIIAEETADIKNDAKIESVEEVVGYTEKEEVVEVKISTGGGTGEGVTGELILEKVETDTNRPLKDVEFTLTKKIGNQEIVVREGRTDEEGKLHWSGLTFGDYTLEENIPEGYLGKESQEITLSSNAPEGIKTLKIENERQKGRVKIVKVDAVTGENLGGAEFKLVNQTTNQEFTFTTDEDGEILKEIPFGEYTVEEITAPEGYRITEGIENITIEVDEMTEIEIANEAIVEVAGKKTWYDGSKKNRPESIIVKLLANDTEIDEKEITEEMDWKYSFTNLDKYDEEGSEIIYTIEEVEVDGYISQNDGYDLINIETTEISGGKTWEEVDSQYRPDSITVNLLANGEKVDSVEVSEETNWTYEFKDLAKYDEEGKEITYSVEEIVVPGYESTVDGFDITNEQIATEVFGRKTWEEVDSQYRPDSITINLLANGEKVDSVEVSEETNWEYEFKGLAKYDKEGKKITYSVEETEVPGYESTVDGYDIINRQIATEVSGEKIWLDDNSESRPESITVYLLANNEKIDELEVTAEINWKYAFTDLPKYDGRGVEIAYAVEEEAVKGYEATYDGYNIINLRVGTTEVDVTKIWQGDKIKDRPTTITVDLLQNGKVIETVEISGATDWKHSFTKLEKYDEEGKAYTYTVQERPVKGYETSIKETETGFEITNTFIEKPTKPTKPTTPQKPALPKTGEASNMILYLVGGAFILLGFILRKRMA